MFQFKDLDLILFGFRKVVLFAFFLGLVLSGLSLRLRRTKAQTEKHTFQHGELDGVK